MSTKATKQRNREIRLQSARFVRSKPVRGARELGSSPEKVSVKNLGSENKLVYRKSTDGSLYARKVGPKVPKIVISPTGKILRYYDPKQKHPTKDGLNRWQTRNTTRDWETGKLMISPLGRENMQVLKDLQNNRNAMKSLGIKLPKRSRLP
ncbi:MAG: hypothetical protein PHQ98_01695 [Candidatus ainarchaeum sp.]|nr:hypothetical protein [Candidatus ainarchaeum sp.]